MHNENSVCVDWTEIFHLVLLNWVNHIVSHYDQAPLAIPQCKWHVTLAGVKVPVRS